MVWKAVAGKGELYSFIVVHRAVVPGSEPGDLIGLVELAEQPGLRLAARLVDVDPDRVRIGMPVQARLVPLPGGDFVVPVFGPPG
jgi:uncharacterized OB-fold protein